MTQHGALEETLRPAKRSRSSTEGRLLRAGLEVFSELGFDAATTRMIAQRAETNEALIHRYFQSKKGLFDALVVKFIEHSVENLDYPMGKDATEELHNFLSEKVHRLVESREFIRIVMARAPLDRELNEKLREYLPMKGDSLLETRLRLLQQKGLIDASVDVNEAAYFVSLSACSFVYMSKIVMGVDISSLLLHFAEIYGRGLEIKASKSDLC